MKYVEFEGETYSIYNEKELTFVLCPEDDGSLIEVNKQDVIFIN